MADIATNIATIQAKAAELDALIVQVRAAKAAIEAAEAEIRRLRPASETSRAYQERLTLVALDQMVKPSIAGDKSIAELAAAAWAGVA
ncbi:hypothetical protein [Mesorhizobium sp. M00.F.Ca.ET.217.01.1.1]|uniref:hypothetical protein n=1 Tax=Mesorhizobium sp. M00.F.Ca.ET.217.01.1.1 TaxID=2500529 RepID=UPI000FD8BD22|nr:hypothetical protein [Mesorhizobium sp. M00.F.Ca.ET.217.01.1.1]TGQ15872.1 hypothetical protein EN860_025275 [Mesorhizobium sp. M00.F.Ca.ET.217.01.1.1]TGQ15877.1 hypothetical protein EN860_025305 [Mesorhizobium sp. M00.F.Ca.ET.217.01.1.1]